MSESQPVLDATLIDFFTIATFDTIAYYKLTVLIEHTYHKWNPKKWMQYSGRKSACGVFHGMGEQGRRAHCIIQVSGQMAQKFYEWFAQQENATIGSFYCTRLDIQRTTFAPDKEYRVRAYPRLRGAKSLIQSSKGTTLYIGARTSDSYWRLYDKTDTHMRCEVELKGKLAKRAWMSLQAGERLGGIFNRFLLRSRVPKVYVDYFRANAEPGTLPELEQSENLGDKLQWLASLDALVYKLANDHDTSERTARLIRRWDDYCDNIDKKSQ